MLKENLANRPIPITHKDDQEMLPLTDVDVSPHSPVPYNAEEEPVLPVVDVPPLVPPLVAQNARRVKSVIVEMKEYLRSIDNSAHEEEPVPPVVEVEVDVRPPSLVDCMADDDEPMPSAAEVTTGALETIEPKFPLRTMADVSEMDRHMSDDGFRQKVVR